jgi:hypothetical protein
MELKNADRPGWAQMTTGLPMDRRPDPQLPQDFWSALRVHKSLGEALDNRSPVEAALASLGAPCSHRAAQGLSRASLAWDLNHNRGPASPSDYFEAALRRGGCRESPTERALLRAWWLWALIVPLDPGLPAKFSLALGHRIWLPPSIPARFWKTEKNDASAEWMQFTRCSSIG